MSLPTAYVPSLSMVVFGPGGGDGSGSAPATPADAAQPAMSSSAAPVRARTPALNPIEQQRTGVSGLLHLYLGPGLITNPPLPATVPTGRTAGVKQSGHRPQ